MARMVLVHGASHGAWCWADVLPHLRDLGHDPVAIDLPSHGADPTPPQTVTLKMYADAIVTHLKDETVLVGHSMAGFPISLAADMAPDRIARLVYLCAYVPQPGRSLARTRRMQETQPLLPAIHVAPDGLTSSFDPDQADDLFYHDCPPGTAERALPQLTPQPIIPMETPLPLQSGFASVPSTYVVCKGDRAIPPAFQEVMAGWCTARRALSTGHAPFFADPQGLAQTLDAACRDTP